MSEWGPKITMFCPQLGQDGLPGRTRHHSTLYLMSGEALELKDWIIRNADMYIVYTQRQLS
jgi:hypothetical protein